MKILNDGWKIQVPVQRPQRDLTNTIKDALDLCVMGYRDEEVEKIRIVIKDFIAQKVTQSVLEAEQIDHNDTAMAILELFKKLTKGDL